MAEAAADPRRGEVRQGPISRGLTTLVQVLTWLLLSLVFSVLVEWVGMVLWWPEEGLGHSRAMLEAELGYLDADFRRSVVTSDPVRFANRVADKIHHALFELTRVDDFLAWVSSAPGPGERGLRLKLHSLYRPVADFVVAAVQVTQVFSVRLAVLILATPVFVLFTLVALVDGFVQRDLRRWGGGRESSFVYHWAKRSALPLLVLSWVVYLALPFSLHPSLVILPFAALFALSVAVTASRFKKYL
jgi:integrating conjugative element membrane protein (TIGR03747 family)